MTLYTTTNNNNINNVFIGHKVNYNKLQNENKKIKGGYRIQIIVKKASYRFRLLLTQLELLT